MKTLAEAGAMLLGGNLSRSEALGGGSLSQIVRIALSDGREAIVKNGPSPKTEAAMLQAIAASGVPAPAVLGVSDEALVIACLPADGSLTSGWASLGTALALLHRTKSNRYGWPQNYAFATLAIDNGWDDNWPRFWAERRLLVHVPHLPAPLARRIETLAGDLTNRLPPRPAPSLLHGDMWGGNVLVDGNQVSGLIDPACYYGHCEVDLGMLTLFDHPSVDFYDAYGPLEPGHDERLTIYRLWPALVHLRLFGSSYRSMVERFLSNVGV
jgi:fructosamine-3-kinase